jgi:hypothetical protein
MKHLISSIEHECEQEAGYLQIFVVGKGGTEEAAHRVTKALGQKAMSSQAMTLRDNMVLELMRLMYAVNTYAPVYHLAKTILDENPSRKLALQGVPKPGGNPK